MNYIPGGLTETRGRQVKQFFSVRTKVSLSRLCTERHMAAGIEELPYFISASDIEK
jgi:hypothetical protein